MEVKAIHMNDLLDKNDDIYENVVVISKRARQIIDSRAIDFDALEEEVDYSDSLKNLDFSDDNLEKPMVVSLAEFLDGDLKWRKPEETEEKQS